MHWNNMLKRVQYNSSLLISAQIAKYWTLGLIFIFSLTYTQTLGDLNQDEVVDILDIVRAVNIILEVPPEPTDYELWASDVNEDGESNIQDIIIIVNIILNVSNNSLGEWINIFPFDSLGYQNTGINGSFISESEGWVYLRTISLGNKIYHTSNGGQDWDVIFALEDTNKYFQYLQFVDSEYGWATTTIMESNWPSTFIDNLLKTTNGGLTWIDITDTTYINDDGGPLAAQSPYFFVNRELGFSSGWDSDSASYDIYKTIDGGMTWEESFVDIEPWMSQYYSVNKFFFLDTLHGWAACSGPAIDGGMSLQTVDGGNNWYVGIDSENPGAPDLFDVHFFDENHGGIVGHNAFFHKLFITEDNFETITYSYDNWPQFTKTICYQNDSTIWVTGYPAIIYRSIDGGASFDVFQVIDSTAYMSIDKIQFFEETGYMFGFPDILLKLDHNRLD